MAFELVIAMPPYYPLKPLGGAENRPPSSSTGQLLISETETLDEGTTEDNNQNQKAPHNWPASPMEVQRPWHWIALDIITDVVLLALSVAFLALGLTVRGYDKAPTETHPHVTDMLSTAITYVRTHHPLVI